MHQRLAALITFLFFGVSLVSVAGAAPAYAKDANCSDFNTQAAAQNYFENNGGGPNNNVDGLDADGDGTACESNPCPCTNYGGGGGGGGGNQPKPFHKLNAQAKEIRNTDKFVTFGRVVTYKGKKITVLRKAGSDSYKVYKRIKTKAATGKFKTQIKSAGNKKTCFRVVVPATKKYRKTAEALGCITTTTQ